nr:MAG TPA: hypothetical protein [Caudoviricetes sp.]
MFLVCQSSLRFRRTLLLFFFLQVLVEKHIEIRCVTVIDVRLCST